MKLEELLPLSVKVASQDDDDEEKVESKASNASEEGVENIEDAAEECSAEKDSAGGKKKGTRKKRSLNWEEAERGLLLEVIKPKVEYVENRSVDAKSIKSKRLAWTQITKQFNALNFRHRLLEQIQVQWRSMKNSAKREYQQKHPKSETLDGMRMIEFMEELQKEPATARSQTRSAGANSATVKKEPIDIDEDEDMPLAALPNSTNNSDDTLQTSTMAIPSPPPSTAGGDSQQESCQQPAHSKTYKKKKLSNSISCSSKTIKDEEISHGPGRKRQRQRHLSQTHSTHEHDSGDAPHSNNATTVLPNNNSSTTSSLDLDSKLRYDLFRLLKQARLAEMDYARREHEQKIRFEEMEQELKLSYYREEQDLKLRQMRDEHDIRMHQQKLEHEARLRVFSQNYSRPHCNAMKTKLENNTDNDSGAAGTTTNTNATTANTTSAGPSNTTGY